MRISKAILSVVLICSVNLLYACRESETLSTGIGTSVLPPAPQPAPPVANKPTVSAPVRVYYPSIAQSKIAQKLDRVDIRLAQNAEMDAFSHTGNTPVRWENTDKGFKGEVTYVGHDTDPARAKCQLYQHTVSVPDSYIIWLRKCA